MGPSRTNQGRTLRRTWTRRLVALFIVIAVGAAAGVVALRGMVSGFQETAVRLEADAELSARLRADIAQHTNAGHTLLEPGGEGAAPDVARLHATIAAEFSEAVSTSTGKELASMNAALAAWEEGNAVIARGEVAEPGERMVAHAQLAERSEAAAALVDEAASDGRRAERAELERAEALAGRGMGFIVGAIVAVLALVIRLGRRLRSEVLVPVSRLGDSARRIAGGDLDHRASFDRQDELGELAATFNHMADAIASSHRDLTRQAMHDSLTGLANRAAFRRRLDRVMSTPEPTGGTQAIAFVDLDDFKDVNDTLGHAAGDELLCTVAERLTDVLRPGDLVARLGGDEFAVLLDRAPDPRAVLDIAERIVAAVAKPTDVGEATVQVAASVGVAFRDEDLDAEEFMRRADVAMYMAKGRGKNRVERYDPGLARMATEHLQLRAELFGAADRGELVLEYQPVADLVSGRIVAVEALVRWQHPTRGLLPPGAFIGPAEETGAIVEIGTWALRTAVHELRGWRDAYSCDDLSLSVNVSVLQLEPAFPGLVESILRSAGVEAEGLVLEVTESVLVEAASGAGEALAALRELGVRVALDDFGTGYSSISYLRRLPVDILKIDRSFVSGDQAGPSGDVLLETIVALGRRLGLDVIPEGIEEADQLERLRALGCRAGQGFLLSRPVPSHAIAELLAQSTKLVPDAAAKVGRLAG
ncbi:MAG TPA: GGDEF domain-containing protein [Acidimicrobiales bacterium]|nr:GGDEF domain-containing protein [Acidimicrobiales bacterium]